MLSNNQWSCATSSSGLFIVSLEKYAGLSDEGQEKERKNYGKGFETERMF
jgi:hypothetical protein